jgi:hypothetical protein
VHVEAGEVLEYDAQCINDDGARDVAVKLEERKECLERTEDAPTFWDNFSNDFTLFGFGALVGIATGVLIL